MNEPRVIPGMTRAAKTASADMAACVYLMQRGWRVYRCTEPTATFHLVAARDGALVRVEVKAISWPRLGNRFDYAPSFAWPGDDNWDLLIVVDAHGVCTEIVDHDRNRGIDTVRAVYGYAPVPRQPTPVEIDEDGVR